MKEQIDKWLSLVCEYFSYIDNVKIDKRKLLGRAFYQEYTRARQVAIYLIRTHVNITLRETANIFDGRKHSVVKYSIEQVEINYMEHVRAIEDMAETGKQERMAI